VLAALAIDLALHRPVEPKSLLVLALERTGQLALRALFAAGSLLGLACTFARFGPCRTRPLAFVGRSGSGRFTLGPYTLTRFRARCTRCLALGSCSFAQTLTPHSLGVPEFLLLDTSTCRRFTPRVRRDRRVCSPRFRNDHPEAATDVCATLDANPKNRTGH
jgi:hypothetical protein